MQIGSGNCLREADTQEPSNRSHWYYIALELNVNGGHLVLNSALKTHIFSGMNSSFHYNHSLSIIFCRAAWKNGTIDLIDSCSQQNDVQFLLYHITLCFNVLLFKTYLSLGFLVLTCVTL